MTYAKHFSVIDEEIAPQPWMQLRQVTTASAESVSKSYDTSGGGNKNELVQTVNVNWINNSPLPQKVYGMVTVGGSQVTLQTRSRGYLSMSHGAEVSPAGAGIQMDEVSRFGVGADIGKGGILATGAAYSAAELRINTTTIPLLPHLTGQIQLDPGEQYNARVEVRFISEFWENTAVDGGDSQTESFFIAGEIRVDLYAIPVIPDISLVRNIPSVVGVTSGTNIDWLIGDTTATVAVPAGRVAGDTLLAITANQFGDYSEMHPVESGWTLLHGRGEGIFHVFDVHLQIYMRRVVAGDPSTYNFDNGFLAEEIAVLILLRNAAAIDSVDGLSWYAGSNLSRWKFVEDQIAPSVELRTQKLICVSYFNHELTQAPIHQTPPPGMTEILDLAATGSTMSIAYLDNPPWPTQTRKFTPSAIPVFSGHSITASILVPGTLV